MLSIRLQRIGRKGHPTYRVVVQDVRQAPTSGRYVALLGSYDPHTKTTTLEKEKAEFYLKNGAQPSDRVVSLFRSEKISIPKWVKEASKQERSTRNPDKLRKNRPAEPEAPEEKVEEVADDQPVAEAEAPAEEATAEKVEEPKAEEDTTVAEKPAEPAEEVAPAENADETAAEKSEDKA
ncbi:30S ribosomal protein S16 [Candidatus Saccharibacteria bacterium]|nr:30S ribosomal protein S16 [Candidatus Saccharibacteria bacterium]